MSCDRCGQKKAKQMVKVADKEIPECATCYHDRIEKYIKYVFWKGYNRGYYDGQV